VFAALSSVLLATACLSADAGPAKLRVTSPANKPPVSVKKAGGASSNVVGIVGGSLGETELQATNELAATVASTLETGPNGEVPLRVSVVPSKGGPQAIRDVLTIPDADFGIVPTLVLDRVQARGEWGDLRGQIAYVAPLYVEELHVIAGSAVTGLDGLRGKSVSVGEDGSKTEIIAREVLAAAHVDVREMHMGLEEALAALKSGEIAAAFVVSGKPVAALKSLSRQDGLQLLPASVQVPPAFLPSTFSAEDYPGLVQPGMQIEALGVQNVLFAYAWPAQSQRGQLDQLFLRSLLWRLEELQVQPRHPKWKEVNVAASLDGWRRLPAMEAWLKKVPQGAQEQVLREEFEGFLKRSGVRANDENRNALFQDFLRWRNNPNTTGAR
jgi:TRAP-type uncharacterized transport system substrate-binding protein